MTSAGNSLRLHTAERQLFFPQREETGLKTNLQLYRK